MYPGAWYICVDFSVPHGSSSLFAVFAVRGVLEQSHDLEGGPKRGSIVAPPPEKGLRLTRKTYTCVPLICCCCCCCAGKAAAFFNVRLAWSNPTGRTHLEKPDVACAGQELTPLPPLAIGRAYSRTLSLPQDTAPVLKDRGTPTSVVGNTRIPLKPRKRHRVAKIRVSKSQRRQENDHPFSSGLSTLTSESSTYLISHPACACP